MSAIFESIQVSEEVKRYVDHSFDVVNRIYDLLKQQGKSQRDLAHLMGKKESEISKWMQGTHNFTLKSIAKIESVLGENLILTPKEGEILVNQEKWAYYQKNFEVKPRTLDLAHQIIGQRIDWVELRGQTVKNNNSSTVEVNSEVEKTYPYLQVA